MSVRRKLLIVVLVASVVCAACLRIQPSFASLSESSYIVDKIGDFWVAQNGTSGIIEFNTTDASTTIQSCINVMASNVSGSEGGRILLRSGVYLLNSSLIIDKPNITLEGEGWRATEIIGNFSGDIIKIRSGSNTPYTHTVAVKNLLLYNPNASLTQTAICLDIKDQFKLWYVDLEKLYVIGMNGIRTDHVAIGADTNVTQGWTIKDVLIENAPQFGIDLCATIDMTIDNVIVNFAQNSETVPVENTTGIAITLSGQSSGMFITNTRVLRAEWGITITGVKDIWMTNVISDICKTWAVSLNNTRNCILNNMYLHSPTGTGLWITGNGSQNRIIGATIKDSVIGVRDDTPQDNPQYFASVISESVLSNSTNWQVKPNDYFINCNHGPTLQDLLANIDNLNGTVINQQALIHSLNATAINQQSLIDSLDSTLISQQALIDALNSALLNVNETITKTITDMQSQLNTTDSNLQQQINYLNQSSRLLNQSSLNLQQQINFTDSTLQTLINQVNTIQNAMYVFAAITAASIIILGYLEIRKTKTQKTTPKK
jgi:hypothetical protein